jgi:hypothetical protein
MDYDQALETLAELKGSESEALKAQILKAKKQHAA